MGVVAQLIKLGILPSVFLTVLGMGLAATWNDATYPMRKPALLVRSTALKGTVRCWSSSQPLR